MNISNPYIHRLISLERKWVILSNVKRFATSIWMQIPFPHVMNFYYPNAFSFIFLTQAFPFDLISAMWDNGLAEKMSYFLEF